MKKLLNNYSMDDKIALTLFVIWGVAAITYGMA